MRPFLVALAVATAAAFPLAGGAHAEEGYDCLADVLQSKMPSFDVLYVDGEGNVVIDPHGADGTVAALQSNLTRFASCVQTCVALTLLQPSPEPVTLVTLEPDGRIVVHPNGADPFVTTTVGRVNALLNCIA